MLKGRFFWGCVGPQDLEQKRRDWTRNLLSLRLEKKIMSGVANVWNVFALPGIWASQAAFV
jgi:hypothetical protein